MNDAIALSPLPKTWLIDIDGTVFQHNAHLEGPDQLLPGVRDFFATLPAQDLIILLTARAAKYESATLAALTEHGLRYDRVIFGVPVGERILINDRKPSGLDTAYAVNVQRDGGLLHLCSSITIEDK
jgi:hypothetical protein